MSGSPPSSPSSPSSSLLLRGQPDQIRCTLKDCLVCKREVPACLNVRSPTWPAIIRVVLYTLQHDQSDKKYFNLKHDIYPFIVSHWKKLCPQKNIMKWKKPMQDALSHGMSLFDSGKAVYGTGMMNGEQRRGEKEVRKENAIYLVSLQRPALFPYVLYS